jgi:alkylation response protein AidB-like acyl-CoA dehydrogenase
MRFALSEEQASFRDAVRDLLAKECPASVVRAAWDAPAGQLDRGVWDSLDAMGVLGLLVPEADGGLGLDETYLVPILEACGRAALPHPVVETAMVAAPLLGAGAGMVSTDLGGGLVPCAADADVLLLRDGDALVSIAPGAVTLEPVATVDGARRAARVAPAAQSATISRASATPLSQVGDAPQSATTSCASATSLTQVGDAPQSATTSRAGAIPLSQVGQTVTDDPAVVELALDRGALGTAAVLVGLGQAMLDLTVGYVQERQQFGVPIGSFQAVKHHLADAALALEFARPAVWRAAWSTAHDEPTRGRDVSMAKAMASDAAELVGRKALQCHGAIGYTVEADLHLYLKRTWALARSWGDSAHHTDRVASALGA